MNWLYAKVVYVISILIGVFRMHRYSEFEYILFVWNWNLSIWVFDCDCLEEQKWILVLWQSGNYVIIEFLNFCCSVNDDTVENAMMEKECYRWSTISVDDKP